MNKTKNEQSTWMLTDDNYSAIPIAFESPDAFVDYVREMQALEPLSGWTIPANPEEHGHWVNQ